MGRKALAITAQITPEQALAPDLMNNLNALAEHQQAIMDKYGEGLPYERERIVHEARFYMAQSAEAMLEAGKRLIILKENEPYGEFMKIVEENIGLPYKTAGRLMKAAFKYGYVGVKCCKSNRYHDFYRKIKGLIRVLWHSSMRLQSR